MASALSYMDGLSQSRYLCGLLLLNINRPSAFTGALTGSRVYDVDWNG